MKPAAQLFEEINNVELTHQEVIERLREFQAEAWNEAIKAAAEYAVVKTNVKEELPTGTDYIGIKKKITVSYEVDKNSILKLKK